MVDILEFVVDIALKWSIFHQNLSKWWQIFLIIWNMINFRTWKCITLPLNEVIWKYLPDLVLHASPGSQNGDFFQCLDPHFLALPRQLSGFPRRGLRIVEKYYHKAFWKTCYPWDLNGPQWSQRTSSDFSDDLNDDLNNFNDLNDLNRLQRPHTIRQAKTITRVNTLTQAYTITQHRLTP